MPPRLTHRNPASVLPPRVAFGWKGSHPLFPLKSSPCSARVFTPLLGAERQPLSASAIGAALHFPSASALEARTPVFLPKPRSAERGVTLSFKVKPLVLFSAGFYPSSTRKATPFSVCHWSSPPLPLHPRARCLDHSFTSRITALATPPSLSPLTGPQFL